MQVVPVLHNLSSNSTRKIPFHSREFAFVTQAAEETASAVATASRNIDADVMLARAKAEAEAWTTGTPATLRLSSEMSPHQVRFLGVIERTVALGDVPWEMCRGRCAANMHTCPTTLVASSSLRKMRGNAWFLYQSRQNNGART